MSRAGSLHEVESSEWDMRQRVRVVILLHFILSEYKCFVHQPWPFRVQKGREIERARKNKLYSTQFLIQTSV